MRVQLALKMNRRILKKKIPQKLSHTVFLSVFVNVITQMH